MLNIHVEKSQIHSSTTKPRRVAPYTHAQNNFTLNKIIIIGINQNNK